jgi:hypothetical protein
LCARQGPGSHPGCEELQQVPEPTPHPPPPPPSARVPTCCSHGVLPGCARPYTVQHTHARAHRAWSCGCAVRFCAVCGVPGQSRGHVGRGLHRGRAAHGETHVHGQNQHCPAVHHLLRARAAVGSLLGRCVRRLCAALQSTSTKTCVFPAGFPPLHSVVTCLYGAVCGADGCRQATSIGIRLPPASSVSAVCVPRAVTPPLLPFCCALCPRVGSGALQRGGECALRALRALRSRAQAPGARGRMCSLRACVCAHVCTCACLRVCVHVCMCACVCVRPCCMAVTEAVHLGRAAAHGQPRVPGPHPGPSAVGSQPPPHRPGGAGPSIFCCAWHSSTHPPPPRCLSVSPKRWHVVQSPDLFRRVPFVCPCFALFH